MTIIQIVVILSVFFASSLGAPFLNENANNIPYLISIQNTILGSQRDCGGAIISPNWVITAAHCVTSLYFLVSVVVAGDFDVTTKNLTESNLQQRNIDFMNVVIHPDYNTNEILNDIAVFKITEPFEFNNFVQPLQISKVPCYALDEPSVFYAWISQKNDDIDLIFEESSLTIIDFDTCSQIIQDAYGNNLHLNRDLHFCASGKNTPCISDGGAPLVQDNRLIGVLSWLSGPCISDHIPAIFTKTGHYKNFIEEHVNDLI